jgi:ferredoxin-NADP reductase
MRGFSKAGQFTSVIASMLKPIHRVSTVVKRVEDVSEKVREFELGDPDDWDLPPFGAGAHIDVHLPSGRVRQYSLLGDPEERSRYRIAVKREDQGRGGSAELHETFRAGAFVPVSLPRNHFPLADAGHHVMIAGGIGITPYLSMMSQLEASGGSFELHYCAKSAAKAPFFDRLAQGRVHFQFSETNGRIDVDRLIGSVGGDTHVYCCGPASLIAAVQSAARAANLGERLHVEFFSSESADGEAEYELRLARSARLVPVAKGQTMLQALRGAGVELPSSCEGGVCLECKTRYLEGSPVHRDLVMKPGERAEYLTPCVSGCASKSLTLDL